MEMLSKWAVFGLLTLFVVACRSKNGVAPAISTRNATAVPTAVATESSEKDGPTGTVRPTATATLPPEPTQLPTAVPIDTPSNELSLTIAALADEVTVSTLVAELPSATGGLAVDAVGNIYAANIGVAPARNGREIYRIMPDGQFELWVEDQALNGASGNTFDQQGNLLQSSLRANVVHRITPDGTVTAFVEDGVRSPVGLTVSPDGVLFVANCGSNTILRVSPTGESELFSNSSLFSCPNGITLDDAGNVYVANFKNGRIVKITPEGEALEFATVPGGNNGHILYLNGLLYVAARRANQIYTLTLSGELTLLAGTGEAGHTDGPALQATFSLPNDIAASPDGRSLYINEAFPTNGVTNSPSVIRILDLPLDNEGN